MGAKLSSSVLDAVARALPLLKRLDAGSPTAESAVSRVISLRDAALHVLEHVVAVHLDHLAVPLVVGLYAYAVSDPRQWPLQLVFAFAVLYGAVVVGATFAIRAGLHQAHRHYERSREERARQEASSKQAAAFVPVVIVGAGMMGTILGVLLARTMLRR